VVQPNTAIQERALLIRRQVHPERGPTDTRRAVFLGRLVALKGPRLAIAALARPSAAAWSLDLYGEGPEHMSLRRFAARLGVTHRVNFKGHRPRREAMVALSSADALLLPSMHDQAGWAVAEALSLGCPVVCLDRGGPAVLVGPGEGVKVRVRGAVVEELAAALGQLSGRIDPVTRWSEERLPARLVEWYRLAAYPRTMQPPANSTQNLSG
jgi:glycosyltransferase involved in cell wall biosynthesis